MPLDLGELEKSSRRWRTSRWRRSCRRPEVLPEADCQARISRLPRCALAAVFALRFSAANLPILALKRVNEARSEDEVSGLSDSLVGRCRRQTALCYHAMATDANVGWSPARGSGTYPLSAFGLHSQPPGNVLVVFDVEPDLPAHGATERSLAARGAQRPSPTCQRWPPRP